MEDFYKSTKNAKVSGVLGGFSEKLNMDLSLLRVLFVLFTVFLAGFPGVIVYVVFAMILPTDVELERRNSNEEDSNKKEDEDSLLS